MLDYLRWRGDLTFKDDPFNEIDNIILSRISYFPLEENKQITLSALNLNKKYKEQDLELLKLLVKSKRYQNAVITNYQNILDKNINEQFAAVTIILNSNLIFVSFCGSNATLVSWHENFDMFYKKEISGQSRSIKYLENVLTKYSQNVIVGGHSKGGNLAIYASSFVPFNLQKKIITVYNNDGPGFNDDIIKENGYLKIINRVITFVPQTTIVSTFFNHKEKEIIVHSNNKGIMQHNMYSWELIANHFKYEKDRDKNSYTIEKIIKTWLKETTKEEREEFTTNLFKIMDATNSDVFNELGINTIKHVDDISKVYKGIDSNKRKEMTNILKLILSISTESFLSELRAKLKIKEK
jgi:hypothetical protein